MRKKSTLKARWTAARALRAEARAQRATHLALDTYAKTNDAEKAMAVFRKHGGMESA